jgi:hypothetical protein
MIVPFEALNENARVWVYQSDRTLTASETETIDKAASEFFAQWQAHGNELKCSYSIFKNQFFVLALDMEYNQASGCSIDRSVQFVLELEKMLGLSFTDRSKVAFLIDGAVQLVEMKHIGSMAEAGAITADTPTFNNLVTSKNELKDKWVLPAGKSWLARYFAQ